MLRFAMTALSIVFLTQPAFGQDGMVVLPSLHAAQTTIDRLEAIAKARDLKIFARIDHAAGARSIGQTLRPTEVLIFGHPKGGTPLLQCDQRYGLELPMRVLAWEDAQGKRWLGYRDQTPSAMRRSSAWSARWMGWRGKPQANSRAGCAASPGPRVGWS